MTLKDKGFEHPFLQLPPSWATAWLVFTVLGTITAFFVVLNEISLLLDYCNSDPCCCTCGCNFVTRSEASTLINIIVEDLPLLILTILLAASRYSCNHPTPSDTSSILKAVLFSLLASAGFVGWTFLRGMFRILVRCCRERNHSHHSEKLDANELYPRESSVGPCMVIHTILMPLLHLVMLTLSIGTIVIVLILLNHGKVGINSDPSKELNVYFEYSNDQVDHLTTSAILQRGDEGFCYNVTSIEPVKCTLLLKYASDDRQLEFNFAPISGSTQESESDCASYLKDIDIFLGHDTATEGVKRFENTCLAAWLIPENKKTVQRNPDLDISC